MSAAIHKQSPAKAFTLIQHRRSVSLVLLTAMLAALLLSCSKPSDEDLDVHRNGLTRRAERLLGIDPSSPTNPLVLVPVATGEEPFTLTYMVPVQADIRSNRCDLVLVDNGKPADAFLFTRQTDGSYLLHWTTTFAQYGSHKLQVEMRVPFHTNVYGPPRLENVTNLVRLDPSTTSFGNKVEFLGFVHVPSADYRIEIFDTNQMPLRTITGHTEKGVIDEVWDLKTTNNEVYGDKEFTAQVYITPTIKDANGTTRSNAPTVRVRYF